MFDGVFDNVTFIKYSIKHCQTMLDEMFDWFTQALSGYNLEVQVPHCNYIFDSLQTSLVVIKLS